MALRSKAVVKFAVTGGERRSTFVCKAGHDLAAANIPAKLVGMNTVFAAVDGSVGSPAIAVTIHDAKPVFTGTVSDPALGSEALVCILKDDEGQQHTYRFPRPLAANLTVVGKNEVLNKVAGDTIASHMSDITGWTMTFIRGYMAQDYA